MTGAWRGAPGSARERLSAADAGARILATLAPLAAEELALADAYARVLAVRVTSPLTMPPWDASAMDGYAVRAADVRGATDGAPAALAVDGTVAAGHADGRPLPAGTARRIMTGAPLPPNADAVVRVEDTDAGGERVHVRRAVAPGRDVRPRGEDVRTGDVVLEAGALLGAAQLGLLAACATATVHVYRQPRVGVLGSGDELVPLDRAAAAIAGNGIVASNNVALAAAVREAGGIPVDLGIAADTVDAVRDRLAGAHACDLVVTTAGVSAGEFDCMHDAVAATGGRAERWSVRMRPGAPMGFGHVRRGPGAVPWVGLSGNPGAALVAFELFVRPAIRRLAGHRALFRRTVPVMLDAPVALAAPVLHLLRVELREADAGDGPAHARLAGAQGAGRLTTAARADALLVVPAGRTHFDAGERLAAIPLGGAPHTDRPAV
ncbi:MAG TPA: gephyrin-like molybdotransferase Glp [Gemmatirosa sp.]